MAGLLVGSKYDVGAMRMSTALELFACTLLFAQMASAEVVRIDIVRRDDFGTHERVIGKVHFAIDPKLPANQTIADIRFAPANDRGQVEFSSDVLFFRPKDAARARGTVFLEVVNRGRDQSLGILSAARQTDLSPASWDLGDRFLLKEGFTVAFLGWQFDVRPSAGLTFEAPIAPVEGVVRESYVETGPGQRYNTFRLAYCAVPATQQDASLTFRTRIEETPRIVPRDSWQFVAGGCGVSLKTGFDTGIHEAIYRAHGSPVAGLGMAAIRDFASYLRYGKADAALRETPAGLQRVIGYGYSQSGRFLREFVRDGFNADERGRLVFDGLTIASAGAGGGSFNHRFAMPGVAGNSVLSILRPVDVAPFDDDGLLARARATSTVPKIFYTFTSTEYWARAGSLTHTTGDGSKDAQLAPTSRLYFFAGTAHAGGPLPPTRLNGQYRQYLNFALQRWSARALTLDLDAWVHGRSEPPASAYPSIARGELAAREDITNFPKVASFPFASYLPQVWRMDYGPGFPTDRVITREPPALGATYRVLVPRVDADGNDVSGIRIPEVAVPLGTYAGWNVALPQQSNLQYLAGLVGSFEPFASTKEEREERADPRLSIAERYRGRSDYLNKVRQASETLVKQRFMLPSDLPAVLERASEMWGVIAGSAPR